MAIESTWHKCDQADREESAVARILGALTADEIRAVADRLNIDANLLHGAAKPHAVGGTRAEPPAHIAPPTREDIVRNNLKLEGLSPKLWDLESFIPELKKKSPSQVIQLLRDRFGSDPSAINSVLLQRAINRASSSGVVDDDLKHEIAEAMRAFHKKPDSKSARTDDIFYTAYRDANYGGGWLFADLPPGWVYFATPYVGDDMNDAISSLTFSCTSSEFAGNVCLFENGGYNGRYQNYWLPVLTQDPEPEYVSEPVPYVGDAFNDITSSTLIVRRFANETLPVQVGGLFPQDSITSIVNAQANIGSAGPAKFTWDMWPTGANDQGWHPDDPAKMFIYVTIPIYIDTHTIFGEYYAEIHYWVYLYVDGSGTLQGYVNWYNCYVQAGWITGDVASALSKQIPSTLGRVNNLIADAVAQANIGGPYRFIYYLPGNNVSTGNTSDGVMVVAVPAS